MIIDSHVHVWEQSRPLRPYPWTPDPHPRQALEAAMDPLGIDMAYLVTPLIEGWDNSYSFETARAGEGRYRVFGRFDIFAPDPGPRLERYMAGEFAGGIRLTLFGEEKLANLTTGGLREFWEVATSLGVNVCVFAPDILGSLLDVMHEFPRLRLVVDHFGLGVYDGCVDPTAGLPMMRAFAEFPQVLAKLSGIVEVSDEPYPFADVRPIVADALEWFGADRLMWGSNYPVVVAKCSYRESLDHLAATGLMSPAELAQVLGGTAARMAP